MRSKFSRASGILDLPAIAVFASIAIEIMR